MLNGLTTFVIEIVSVLRTSDGRELSMSTDSSIRKYYPDGTPSGLMSKVAKVEELVIVTHDSSEPVFYLRLIASVSPNQSSA